MGASEDKVSTWKAVVTYPIILDYMKDILPGSGKVVELYLLFVMLVPLYNYHPIKCVFICWITNSIYMQIL